MSQIFQRLRQKRSPVSHVYHDGGETGPALAFRAVLQFGPPLSNSVAWSLRRRRRSNSRLDVIKRFVHVDTSRKNLGPVDRCPDHRLFPSLSRSWSIKIKTTIATKMGNDNDHDNDRDEDKM